MNTFWLVKCEMDAIDMKAEHMMFSASDDEGESLETLSKMTQKNMS